VIGVADNNKDILNALNYIMDNMTTKDDLNAVETRINIKIENEVTKRLDALTDGYKSVHEKQWELERQNEKLLALVDDLQVRVSALENRTA
jgi:hypothetical protein